MDTATPDVMRSHVLLYCFLRCGMTTVHVSVTDSAGTFHRCNRCNGVTFA